MRLLTERTSERHFVHHLTSAPQPFTTTKSSQHESRSAQHGQEHVPHLRELDYRSGEPNESNVRAYSGRLLKLSLEFSWLGDPHMHGPGIGRRHLQHWLVTVPEYHQKWYCEI